jgi:MerR family transcriptional regulator, redox-sensitive transcriptional activator SoxR
LEFLDVKGEFVNTWTIGKVAGRLGIAPSTIRYYEEIGLLPPAPRVNGRRRYDATVFGKLGVIRRLQRAGFTIAEIHTLIHRFPTDVSPTRRWRSMARQKLEELDARVQSLRRKQAMVEQLLHCECVSLDECGEKALETACNDTAHHG